MVNWKEHGNPLLEFTEKITQQWKSRKFYKEECLEWINLGLKAEDAVFASWLRDKEKKTPTIVLNEDKEDKLREKFSRYLERLEVKNELDEDEEEFLANYRVGLVEKSEKEETKREKRERERERENELSEKLQKVTVCENCQQREMEILNLLQRERKVSSLEEENSGLQKANEEFLESMREQVADKKKSEDNLNSLINSKESEIKRLESKNENLNKKIAENQTKIAEQENAIAKLRSEKDKELRKKEENSEKEKVGLKNNISELEEKNSELVREKDDLISAKNSAQKWKIGLSIFAVASFFLLGVMLFSEEKKPEINKKKLKPGKIKRKVNLD